jgi:two-component system cell cycle response regulator DivK
MEKPNVLIVEDNKINALVLKKAIAPICQTTHAINDRETFEAVKQQVFQVILMDINLGGNSLDGEKIMKILKADPQYAHTQIFAVTSYAMPGDQERFLAAGFDAYFSKPIVKTAIIDGLQQAFATVQTR